MKWKSSKSWRKVTIMVKETHTIENDIKVQNIEEVTVWINPEEWRSIFSDLLMKNK